MKRCHNVSTIESILLRDFRNNLHLYSQIVDTYKTHTRNSRRKPIRRRNVSAHHCPPARANRRGKKGFSNGSAHLRLISQSAIPHCPALSRAQTSALISERGSLNYKESTRARYPLYLSSEELAVAASARQPLINEFTSNASKTGGC